MVPGSYPGPFRNSATPSRLRIEPDEALAFVEESRQAYERSREEFVEQGSIEVVYEDLDADFDETMGRLFVFLGMEPNSVVPDIHRQEQRPLSETIENWRQVRTLGLSKKEIRECLEIVVQFGSSPDSKGELRPTVESQCRTT